MSTPNSSTAKLTIVGFDVPTEDRRTITTHVEAQYNPKELAVSKAVPWQKAPSSTGDQPELTFTSGEGRTMSIELFFDSYEQGQNVHTTHVGRLQHLAMIANPGGPEIERRPPLVRVLWGSGLPPFYGVIESIDTRYTMFLPGGIPVRATCTIRLREADRASFRKGA